MFLPYNTSVTDQFTLKIPEGYSVEYLPKNFNNTNEKYSYSIEYSVKGDEIIYKQNINVDDLMIESQEFNDWNNFIKGLEKAYKQTILLRKDEK